MTEAIERSRLVYGESDDGSYFENASPMQDSADAIDNMHNAELYGRVLRCNYAQPMKIKGGDKGFSHQPVWADADDWYERAEAENELAKLEEVQRKKAEAEKLKAGQIQKDPMEEAEAAAMSGNHKGLGLS